MESIEQARCLVLWSNRRFFCPSFRAAEHIDIGEHAHRRRVAAVDHLVRLALAAILRAMHLEGARIADGAQTAPERRRYATVVWILYHADSLSFLDELAPFAAELELVARIVYRPRHVGAHQHAAAHGPEHRGERARARLDVDVRHAIDRRPVPATGAGVRRD